MDMYALDLFNQHNITVVYVTKVTYNSQDEAEMYKEFTQLKSRDPRIILSHSKSAASIYCWYHRVGLFGPQYVIATLSWIAINPSAIPLPKQWPWCTKKMILEVAQSVFPFGDGLYSDAKDDGPSTDDFHSFLRTRITNVTDKEVKGYWPPLFYDRAHAVGLILNHTEHILKQERNETLSDWLTNGENFKRNGSEIAGIIKRASLNLEMTGFKGKYGFKTRNGMTVSKPFLPIVISQIVINNFSDVENAKYQLNNIAYHDLEEGMTLHTLEPIQWRTFNRKPPVDEMKVTIVKLPMLPFGLNVALKTISAISLVLIAVVTYFHLKSTSFENAFSKLAIAIGSTLLLCLVFFIPIRVDLNDSLVNQLCSVIVFIVAIGFDLIVVGIYALFADSKRRKIQLALWLFVNVILMAVSVGISQEKLAGESNLSELDIEYVPNTDFSQAIRPKRWSCVAVLKAFTDPQNYSILVLIGISGVGNLLLLGKSCLDAYKKTAKKKRRVNKTVQITSTGPVTTNTRTSRFSVMSRRRTTTYDDGDNELKKAANCIYCQILVLIAACFIAVLQPDNHQYLLIVLSFSCLAFVFLNIAFILSGKLHINFRNA